MKIFLRHRRNFRFVTAHPKGSKKLRSLYSLKLSSRNMGLPANSTDSTENSESSESDSSVGSTEWDGDNTSDYKGSEEEEEEEDSTEEWDSENVSSLRTETSLRQLLTTDQMITAGELKKNIKESLNILRSCRVVGANSRVNVEGKKVTTRARIGNCPIVASDCIDQMMQDEKDRLFKRVCKGNIQSKDAFMKQSAQFLTFAVDTGELGYDEDNDDLVTLIGRVVLSPVSIVRIYAEGSTQSVADSLANKIKRDIKEMIS